MSKVETQLTPSCHVVAMPYPDRGHVNPMMNLCKLVAENSSSIQITFVVTEEWLGLIGGSITKPDNIHFATIPNVIPSEHVRGSDLQGFVLAVWSKMEDPFERLLVELQLAPTLIIADGFVPWTADLASRRNIPLAVLWPMSASVFSVFYHFDLIVEHGHFPVNLSANGDDIVVYIPGLSPTRIADIPTIVLYEEAQTFLKTIQRVFDKAHHLVLTSIYELESNAIDAIKAQASFSIYTIGPSTIYLKVNELCSSIIRKEDLDYLKWLNLQPPSSVLYVSMGSHFLISSSQMDEIAFGLRGSGTRFLWVARGETSRLQEICGEKGLVVPWCDQLRVLCHPSVGGFLSHCGWNSTIEAILVGVPVLTFPIMIDQVTNSKMIVEDWQIGWRVKRGFEEGNLVKGEEIVQLVKRFMNMESPERKLLEEKVEEIQRVCESEFSDHGSLQNNVDSFTKSIIQSYHT